ncbi:MAG: glycosyltransferase [Candidatus Eisenbacteria bacterium]
MVSPYQGGGTGSDSGASVPARGPVLLVAPEPFYEDRGTPIAIRQVLKGLSDLGYEVDLLTFPCGADIELPGLRILRIPNPFGIRSVPIGFSFRKILLDLVLASSLRRRLRERPYILVHAVEEGAFLAAWIAGPRGVPVLYDMQSSLPEQLTRYAVCRLRPVRKALFACERWLLSQVDMVVCSTGLQAHVRARAPSAAVSEWRFSSVWPGDASIEEVARLRERLGIGNGKRVVMYSGSFAPYQGLPTLLDAVPRVLREVPETVFVLVGADGKKNGAPWRDADRMIEEGTLLVLPRRPREEMSTFYALADVVVSPRAYGNNLPLKVYDYMAAGRPIVATDNGSHRKLLDEKCAILVRPDADSLSGGIVRLLRDGDEAARLGAAARSLAREQLQEISFLDFLARRYEALGAGKGVHGRG